MGDLLRRHARRRDIACRSRGRARVMHRLAPSSTASPLRGARHWIGAGIAGIALMLARGAALADTPAIDFTETERRRILQHSPLPPAPADPTNRVADDPAAAHFGQYLFFDPRFSANGKVSCATCHDPANGFSDGLPLSNGIATAKRNAPTLWNVAYNRWYFWDGRADTLWMQALFPMENPAEMGSTRTTIARAIHADPRLRSAYESLFGDLPDMSNPARFPPRARPTNEPEHIGENHAWQAMSPDDREAVNRVFVNVAKAIAAYERKLISRNSPFDRFAAGLRESDPTKLAALSPDAQAGLRLFIGRGKCRFCHSGPNFTDGEFHNVRVPPADGGAPTDPGRYAGIPQLKADPFNSRGPYSDAPNGSKAELLEFLTNNPENWGAFKTPSLRNVTRTAPYMHAGQFPSLDRVLHHYSTFDGALSLGHHAQETILRPLRLTPQEHRQLRAFLESLTDESIDPALLRAPAAPQLPR
ncbi:MAG: cytochrome-c peroxidase [Planctomycetota bacterium]|nr:MAG: cytochrome-c peroxidase [Planctomycetota bacterium]